MRSGILCSALSASLALTGCGGEDARSHPRLVVLYATCTLNKSYLSPYSEAIRFTPELDRFANEGVVFRRHRTEAGQSGPAFASIFSGTQADRHGVFHHPTPLDDELYLVSEAFADAGFETFFWDGHRMASARLNYGQGVADANTFVRRPPDQAMLRGGDARFVEILERLERDPDYKAFVQLAFTVTHGPYDEYTTPRAAQRLWNDYPETFEGITQEDVARLLPHYKRHRHDLQWNLPETARRLGLDKADVEQLARVLEMFYSCCVYQLDRYFGAFVESIRARGLMDQSVIAFTADHGEMLYRENALFYWAHGAQLVPEALDVPWILHAPGVAPRVYEDVTRSIDVFPTLAGLAGIELASTRGVEGANLAPVLRGDQAPPELIAFSRTTTISPEQLRESGGLTLFNDYYPRYDPELMWVGARVGDRTYKLRDWGAGDWHLRAFDLASDATEARDVFDADDPEEARVARALEAYRARLVESFLERGRDATIESEEIEDELRAMGYIR